MGCPISMTYSVIPAIRKQPELAAEWEPRFLSLSYDGERLVPAPDKKGALCGMAMTEKQGGSDVRANTTVARPLNGGGPGAEYEITGHKWFCSAPMCDAFLVLAQADGGLSCFLLPRFTPDGERNRFHIQRLKDKLGNRSNASSEVEFRGAWARLVGEEGRGVPTIIDMVNHTRLDCVIGVSAGFRWGTAMAIHHASHRSAFGKPLVEQPLMRNVLADLAVESEAATISALWLARAFDEAHAGDERAVELRRLATPVLKYWTCKRAPVHAVEALECLGGNGYVEESGMPRLYRESPLASIWEGSGNVQCLDVLRAMAKNPASVETFFAEIDEAQRGEPPPRRRRRRASRGARRPRGDRSPGAPRRRVDGAGAPGLASGPLRRPGGRRRLFGLPAGWRRRPRVRHPAGRGRLRPDHRAPRAFRLAKPAITPATGQRKPASLTWNPPVPFAQTACACRSWPRFVGTIGSVLTVQRRLSRFSERRTLTCWASKPPAMATNPLGHLAVTVLGLPPPKAVTDTTLSPPGLLLLCAIGATTISAIAAAATDADKAAFQAFI